MEDVALEGELLDYFRQFMEWIKKNQSIDDSHLERLNLNCKFV